MFFDVGRPNCTKLFKCQIVLGTLWLNLWDIIILATRRDFFLFKAGSVA